MKLFAKTTCMHALWVAVMWTELKNHPLSASRGKEGGNNPIDGPQHRRRVPTHHLPVVGGRWAAGGVAFVHAQHAHTHTHITVYLQRSAMSLQGGGYVALCGPDGGTLGWGEVVVGALVPFPVSSGWHLALLHSYSSGTSALPDAALSPWGQYLKSPPSPPRQRPHDLLQPRIQSEDVSYQEHCDTQPCVGQAASTSHSSALPQPRAPAPHSTYAWLQVTIIHQRWNNKPEQALHPALQISRKQVLSSY